MWHFPSGTVILWCFPTGKKIQGLILLSDLRFHFLSLHIKINGNWDHLTACGKYSAPYRVRPQSAQCLGPSLAPRGHKYHIHMVLIQRELGYKSGFLQWWMFSTPIALRIPYFLACNIHLVYWRQNVGKKMFLKPQPTVTQSKSSWEYTVSRKCHTRLGPGPLQGSSITRLEPVGLLP